MSNNKLIAKNTLFLYFRMLFIMGVTLYVARVVLDKLGVVDYELYNVVGGVVGMLSFLNGTLSSGTSRFVTFELGRKDKNRLLETFNTAILAHVLLAVLFIVILETAGMWYITHKAVIPPERLTASIIVFQLSILAACISIVQIPYTSLIIGHEHMGIYAYIGIFEAVGRLAIAYCLTISSSDRLILYAALTAVLQLLVAACYYAFCRRRYAEARLRLCYKKDIFKSLMGFSGWNVLANFSETLKLQGYLILLNLFFQPFVVVAQSFANQVAGAMMQFVNNFRTAIYPQVIKQYAAGDFQASKKLTLDTTVLSFDLVLLLGLPAIFVMDTIMDIWLVEVPPYTVLFTQYVILQRILSVFDSSFYTPLMAAAKVKTNSIASTLTGPILFVTLYIIFLNGGDVMWMQYTGIIVVLLFSFVIKPVLLVREVEGYRYADFLPCFMTCIKVALMASTLTYLAYLFIGNTGLASSLALFACALVCVLLSSYVFLPKDVRAKTNAYIARFIHRKTKT